MSTPDPSVFERLGAFYLGREIDGPDGEPSGPPLLYDSRDLTTHAVIVGMTGSGKTGLAVGLLEEAALDGVPAIAIDVKGDLTNLLLTFPGLRAEDFRPWIDAGAAQRKGKTPEELAADTAELWRSGLASWGQDGARIAALRKAVDVRLYTPGSTSVAPVSLLQRLDAPAESVRAEADALADRIDGTVSGLLTLVDVDADPVTSREHILISRILDDAWRAGRSLSLADLIRSVQDPPFDSLGVVGVDSFFPARDRAELALRLNNLLASPGFRAWREGVPLDIPTLLHDDTGRPRLSILYLAHLSDAERMFFVTRLLGDTVAWMRTQAGTESLRALIYMDEVFGYFPPTANPPSKRPLLTLMKQARAFGLGVVLATQNPVDLDYKGLSNAGTWMLGRLQTERDKARVLDGLESAAEGGSLDRSAVDRMLSSLGKRRFLLHNVHDDGPTLFHTRWAMSYLAGPLTIAQVRDLVDAGPSVDDTGALRTATPAGPAEGERPLVAPEIEEFFVTPDRFVDPAVPVRYVPHLYAEAKMHFVRASWDVDHWSSLALLAGADDPSWEEAAGVAPTAFDRSDAPAGSWSFAPVPAAAADPDAYRTWRRDLADVLYRTRPLRLYRCKPLDVTSNPGESEADFRARIRHLARERRDDEIDGLRDAFERRLGTVRRRERSAEERVVKEEAQYDQQRLGTVLDVGSTLLGSLLGSRRRSSVTGVSRAAKRLGRAAQEKTDIRLAKERLDAVREEIAVLEAELAEEIRAMETAWQADTVELETLELAPRKSDIDVGEIALAWIPCRIGGDGTAVPLAAL